MTMYEYVRVRVISHDVRVPQGGESRQAAPRACMRTHDFAKVMSLAYLPDWFTADASAVASPSLSE